MNITVWIEDIIAIWHLSVKQKNFCSDLILKSIVQKSAANTELRILCGLMIAITIYLMSKCAIA